MDRAARVIRSPTPSLCRRVQSSLVVLVVICYVLFLGHVLRPALSGCASSSDSEAVSVNTTEPSAPSDTEHCWNDTCFVKCCPDDQGIASSETFNCSGNGTDLIFDSVQFVTKVMSKYQLIMEESQRRWYYQKNNSSDYFVFYDRCGNDEEVDVNRPRFTIKYNNSLRLDKDTILLADGMYIFREMRQCVDFVLGTDLMVLLGCSMDSAEHSIMSLTDRVFDVVMVSCMIVSTIAITIVLGVYIYLPQLHGPHRNILICYLLLVMALHPTAFLSVSYYINSLAVWHFVVFLFLGSISWLTIMSYDIWSTFSRPLRPRTNSSSADPTRHRFLVYSLVGWGFPITHLLLWIYIKCVTKHIILLSHIVFAMVLTLVMFLSTIVNLRVLHSVHTNDGVRNSRRHNYTKQGLLLYLKLSLLMGVDWVVFVISWCFKSISLISAAYVLLECQGTFLFVLLVCNRRVLRLLRNRWRGHQSDTS